MPSTDLHAGLAVARDDPLEYPHATLSFLGKPSLAAGAKLQR